MNSLRNIEMLKSCWKELSKRTVEWGEIRVTIEDQLTVQRNWNLHPSNPNPDMTGLKDAYRSGKDNHLGKTGQVRMEVNVVTAPVGNALVIYATANPAQTWPTIFVTDWEDTLNALSNCFECNKPGHVKRDCPVKTHTQSNYNRGQKRELSCYNCDKKGHMAWN